MGGVELEEELNERVENVRVVVWKKSGQRKRNSPGPW